LPIDVDFAAIIITESLGILSFLVALLFFRARQKISNKQRWFLDALNNRAIKERGTGRCYSSEWAMDKIVYRPKKLLNATPLLLTALTFLLAVFYYLVAPHIIGNILSFGYSSVIALIGVSILLWTDAFQAYSYTNAIHKVAAEQLDKEDQSYIELAREAVEKAFIRFVTLGVSFALLGPFIPQIFNGFVYAFVMYAAVFFQVSEASLKILTGLGMFVVLILPVFMLFLPEFLVRILIRKGKSIANNMLKRKARTVV
jgi:hypothetical protein